MIAQLTGKPIVKDSDLIIDVAGVGYQVLVSDQTLAKIGGQLEVTLSIFTHVREDTLELFGFIDPTDKKLFQLLLGVSGVGPKTALVISSHGANSITQAVQEADVTFFTKVPRVGKKLAQKIIIDLKSKLGSLRELELGGVTDPKQKEVVEALLALGFEEQKVYQSLHYLDLDNDISKIVKQALKIMNSSI
jgi:holliday junction DNA helicase RuvA